MSHVFRRPHLPEKWNKHCWPVLTGSETRIFAFHVCQAVILVKIYISMYWISAGKFRAFDAPQISTMICTFTDNGFHCISWSPFYAFGRYNLIPACFKIFQPGAFLRAAFYFFCWQTDQFMNENLQHWPEYWWHMIVGHLLLTGPVS